MIPTTVFRFAASVSTQSETRDMNRPIIIVLGVFRCNSKMAVRIESLNCVGVSV